MIERVRDTWETLRVRWIMLDAQQRQVILLAALYAGYTLLDIVGAIARAKLAAKGPA